MPFTTAHPQQGYRSQSKLTTTHFQQGIARCCQDSAATFGHMPHTDVLTVGSNCESTAALQYRHDYTWKPSASLYVLYLDEQPRGIRGVIEEEGYAEFDCEIQA